MSDLLNPESHRGEEPQYWATFSDIALATLLIFILFILAQFLHYERMATLEEIARRKRVMEERIERMVARHEGIEVEVYDEDPYHQRIRVFGELVFAPCRDDLTKGGRSLILDLGLVLGRAQDYFESVQVEGHADRQFPRSYICQQEGIDDNWQLSARRATEVVRVFSRQEMLANATLSSVGRGEYHPLSDPGDESIQALRRDRRIEIVLRYTDEGIVPGG